MRRAWLTGATVLVAAGVLAGCSPPRYDLVAAYNGDDGKPWIMLAPCGRNDITSVHVSSWPTDPGRSPYTPGAEQQSGWWSDFDPGIGGGSLPLFAPPGSWSVQPHGEQRILPGRRYSVDFYSPEDGVYYGEVYFTAEDLAGLEPGEVWAGDRAMTRKEFREYRAGKC
ncbi:hypothetical protein [Streptomyces erythrochromogenes]|uniref:hypothetical protein n=1 Tax=Streptomyces erythrochromogenes TaxID=285574 RepID=UPI00386D0F3E|nr:hypothetical protein OG364_13005 [Streptomyces erythrochromogenes]